MQEIALPVALVALLIPVVVIDIRERIIPNRLLAVGAAVALTLLVATERDALNEHLIAAVCGGGFLLLAALLRPGGMGMGDVKLAFVLGLFLGRDVVVALVVALLAGTLYGVLLIARGEGKDATLPFGPFLAFGAVVAPVVSDWLLTRYFDG